MFHPAIIARAEAEIVRVGGRPLPRRSFEECRAMVLQLADAVDAKGERVRALTHAENEFLFSELLLCRIDYRYFSDRYAVIAKETAEAEPIHPRWKSQEIFLQHLAQLEYTRVRDQHPDGILINALKGRQLGLSTEVEVILAHRILTQTSIRGLVAGDVPEQSKYLFGMAELVVEHAPWWLRPATLFHQSGSYLQFITGASLRAAAGKSQRGGLQDKGGTKGNIGRGKTTHVGHLSEISTWERPEQIDDGLLPGVPRRRHVFLARESTAKGRNDYWHLEWQAAAKGHGRFTNIFIPWYTEPEKYWEPAPIAWDPSPTTAQHAALVERTSPQFFFGQTVRLSREQLYWYERTRATFEAQENLHKFLEEYPAEPEEAFQYAGRSIFNSSMLESLRAQEQLPIAVVKVSPAKDIAQLTAWEREQNSAASRGGVAQ